MWHYARGMAFTAQGHHADAAREQALVDAAAQAMPIDRLVADNQPARRQLELASAVLAGERAARRGKSRVRPCVCAARRSPPLAARSRRRQLVRMSDTAGRQ